MIRYALKCAGGHAFDSWFGSSAAFDRLQAAGHLACPDCGSTAVEKAPMAPRLAGTAPDAGSTPDPHIEALAKLRAQVEANSEYVGVQFATEARRIHSGEAPARSIYGETRPDEARALLEDGVPIAPLPFVPRRKTN